MAYTIPTREPTHIEAGTSLIFTRDLPDFPPATWTLSYSLRNNEGAAVDFTATQDGTLHKVNETSSTTAAWTPGKYKMFGHVTDGTERHKIYESDITITLDPSVQLNFDQRTDAEIILANLIAQAKSGHSGDVASYSINGRSYTFKTTTDWLEEINYWRSQVAHEKAAGKNRKILIRFVRPQ